ncbi:MAG: universal stress protein [Sideroxydans sp.]|nr:universal stress protein [Sideroxydans sp.]MDD5470428.1 universal stress protein [Sideroxydans sp.]
MTAPRTIVVATDFSASATRAVRQAAHLARAWDARLILVHVFNDSVWASLRAVYDLPGWNDVKPLAGQRARLTALATEIAQEFALPVDTEVLTGRASQQIGEIVAARRADLLVVGEHGENWVNDIVLGGTALKVIEAARAPVLLVRGERPALYRDILVAADFSEHSERAARLALDAFPDAQLVLIHAWLVPLEASMRLGGAREEDIEHYRSREFAQAEAGLASLVRRLGAAEGRLQPLALHGSPASVIFDQAEARGSDLIVIGKHGGSPLDERLLGSVTQNILYHASCDVLLSA